MSPGRNPCLLCNISSVEKTHLGTQSCFYVIYLSFSGLQFYLVQFFIYTETQEQIYLVTSTSYSAQCSQRQLSMCTQGNLRRAQGYRTLVFKALRSPAVFCSGSPGLNEIQGHLVNDKSFPLTPFSMAVEKLSYFFASCISWGHQTQL